MNSDRGHLMSLRLHQSHKDAKKDFKRSARRSAPFFYHNYLAHLPANKSLPILDVGAGLGQFLSFCRSMGYKNAEGIDLSSDNVEICKSNKLQVQHADAYEFLANNRNKYGAIILNDVIEHQTKEQIWVILQLINDSLLPDGVLIMKTINMANPVMGAHSRYNDFTHEVGWTEESMRQVLEKAGYSSVKVLPSRLYVYYKNPLNYLGLVFESVINLFFRAYFILNARGTTKVFSKNLIAVARKSEQVT